MQRILLIEDNANIAEGIATQLQMEGYDVRIGGSVREAEVLVTAFAPHLLILDLMLPDGDGTLLLAQLRRNGVETPVLVLSALGGELHKVAGFRAGADDYVTKPFGLLELLARVSALLRRSVRQPLAVEGGDILHIGTAVVNLAERTVRRDGELVVMRPREWDLLLALLRHENAVVSRATLLREVWGYDSQVQSRTVDTHIVELRRKLGDDGAEPRHIQTTRKLGYRLVRT